MSRFVVLAVLVAFVAGCPSDKKDQASVEKKAGATTVKADSPEGKVRVKASDKATTVEAGGTKVEVDEKTGTVKVNAPGAKVHVEEGKDGDKVKVNVGGINLEVGD